MGNNRRVPLLAARRTLRHPLVLFLVGGAALAALASGLAPPPPAPPISLSADDLVALRREWLTLHGSEPDASAWDALVREAIDDELLFREARALDFARSDPVVRQRLLRDLEFLDDGSGRRDRSPSGEDQRVERALALGLDQGDLVVRRRLVQRMRAVLSAPAREAPVTPEEIARRYARDRAAGLERLPARFRITQIFLGPASAALADPEAVRARAEDLGPERADALGAPLLVERHLGPASAAEIARRLGGKFASALEDLPVGDWSGPVVSSYGLHLVFVHERIPGRERSLEEAAPEIERSLRDERGERAVREALERLRARSEIHVAPIPADG